MALLPVLHHPDRRLRIKAEPITRFDKKIARMADDMLETMYHEQGVGLAGTQVNFHKRLVVIDISERGNQPLVLVNPEITFVPDATIQSGKEGCLSVPDFSETVSRPDRVLVDYQDTDGLRYKLDASGLLAVCIQHECDHLEGKLFIDYLSQLKRQRISLKLKKRKLAESA